MYTPRGGVVVEEEEEEEEDEEEGIVGMGELHSRANIRHKQGKGEMNQK
jgi:hypothetical protein